MRTFEKYREQQATYYNRTSKRLQPIQEDVVRVQSKNGFKKKGVSFVKLSIYDLILFSPAIESTEEILDKILKLVNL